MEALGIALSFVGLGVNFVPAEPNADLARGFFIAAGVCIVVGLFLLFWPEKAEPPTASATQSGRDSTLFQAQTQTIHYGQGHGPPQAETAAVVVNRFNPGPVSIPEDDPYVLQRPKYIGMGGVIVCVVPFYGTEPAATIEVEGAEEEYDVVVSYKVESVAEGYSAPAWNIALETRVQVLDEDGGQVASLFIDKDETGIDDDGYWERNVTGRSALIGLRGGTYGLRVVDHFTTTLGHRHEPRRDYRDMRLRVTHR